MKRAHALISIPFFAAFLTGQAHASDDVSAYVDIECYVTFFEIADSSERIAVVKQQHTVESGWKFHVVEPIFGDDDPIPIPANTTWAFTTRRSYTGLAFIDRNGEMTGGDWGYRELKAPGGEMLTGAEDLFRLLRAYMKTRSRAGRAKLLTTAIASAEEWVAYDAWLFLVRRPEYLAALGPADLRALKRAGNKRPHLNPLSARTSPVPPQCPPQ